MVHGVKVVEPVVRPLQGWGVCHFAHVTDGTDVTEVTDVTDEVYSVRFVGRFLPEFYWGPVRVVAFSRSSDSLADRVAAGSCSSPCCSRHQSLLSGPVHDC